MATVSLKGKPMRTKPLSSRIRYAGVVAALLAAMASSHSAAQQPIEQRSSGENSTNIGINNGVVTSIGSNNGTVTINQQDPATLAAMTKVFADQMSATATAKAQAEAKAADLASRLGVTTTAVAEFFRIVGAQNVPQDKIAERLSQIAQHFMETQKVLASLRPDDPAAAGLAIEARQALDAGRLEQADALLDHAKDLELAAYRAARQVRKQAREAEDQHALAAARMLASRGGIALTRLDYLVAAEEFGQAADLLPDGDRDSKIKYLFQRAGALFARGYEFGDDTALLQAIGAYRELVRLLPRDLAPKDWAAAQDGLGMALLRMGEHTLDDRYFQGSISAFRAALQEQTRDRQPIEWAGSQDALGVALYRAGRTREAVAALTAALEERTRQRDPKGWAATQNDLGLALVALARHEGDSEHLLAAMSAYRAALEVSTRDSSPFAWAQLQNNLGWAHLVLGQRNNDAAQFAQAVTHFRASLTVRTRQRLPYLWGIEQANLGRALTALGESEAGTASLSAAIDAFKAALEVRDRNHLPVQWALLTRDQALAELLLAQRAKDQATAGEAVELLESACAYLIEDSQATYCQGQLSRARAVVEQLKPQ